MEYTPRPVYRLRGSFKLRMSWAGDESWRYARRIAKCLTESVEPVFRVDSTRVETISGEPLNLFSIVYLTPAQYKFRGAIGKQYILSIPSVSRLLKPGLELLGIRDPGVYKDIDYYTGIVKSTIEKATVYLDPLKPTNWTLTGELTIALSNETPKRVADIIATATRLIYYTGSGKSRLEGLGQVKVVIEK